MAKIIYDPETVDIFDLGHRTFLGILQDIPRKLGPQPEDKNAKIEGFSAVVKSDGRGDNKLLVAELAWRGIVFAQLIHFSNQNDMLVRSGGGNGHLDQNFLVPVGVPAVISTAKVVATDHLIDYLDKLRKITVSWHNRELAAVLGVPITHVP